MQRIGLFGGSFNPIHLGHLHLAQTAMTCLGLDRLILIPTAVSPFKQQHPDMASPEDRLMMCRLAAETIPGCQVDDCELSRGGVSYTIDTVRHFRAQYPKAQLVLLLGSDMFLSFPKWRSWREILALAELGVVSREVDDRAILEQQKNKLQEYGSVSLCLAPPFPVSSTQIREKCKKHQDYSCYLPEKVVQYIRMHHLYQTSTKKGDEEL